ncbi:MAG: hypothetical protein NZ889_01390 [Candidatus Pacearchaeota archaeon]|nr:hypothetical protein [Candidatus Pacearchaeota archaeon]
MKKESFEKICWDIKNLKIQGAEQVARAALKALLIRSDSHAIKKLFRLRPTEPCLRNCLRYALSFSDVREGVEETLKIMDRAREKIKKIGAELIQDNKTIFLHCHSSTVISILLEAKKQGKKFEVYNTETRPNLQGRITAKELLKARIPVTMFVDSAATIALKKASLFLFGVDAITSTGSIINKIGNKMMAEIAYKYEVPRYACSFSWKFDPETTLGKIEKLEKRKESEVWKNKPKGLKISNIVFEEIPPELITGIVSELGVLQVATFISELEKTYPFLFYHEK